MESSTIVEERRQARVLGGLNIYQWTVLVAAWLGWGFDVFDSVLFNYVAPNCVPALLHLKLGSAAAAHEALRWNGLLTSVLLVGWAVGGIIFGRVGDRIGRTRTLMLTMGIYALGTAASALAPNIYVLGIFRIVASLGIGGEWAAGAAMVAEVVPERRRVEAGALLYTSAPMGLFPATFVNYQIAGVHLAASPETSWRFVFLCGLIPAVVVFAILYFVKEPERWTSASAAPAPRLREIFSPQLRARTFSGFIMAVTALIMWWSCNAFIPIVAKGLASTSAAAAGLAPAALRKLNEVFVARATNAFNLGGLIGTLLTVPVSKHLGRKTMLRFTTRRRPPRCSLRRVRASDSAGGGAFMYFPVGLTVFGVFGSFTYYLPELFPTRLRCAGAGFCYNVGRIIAAAGPFLVGRVAAMGANTLHSALGALFCIGFVPVVGLIAMPWVVETRGRALED